MSADLLAELQAELGEWGRVSDHPDSSGFWVYHMPNFMFLPYAALRKHGPRAVADALRLLAGSDQ